MTLRRSLIATAFSAVLGAALLGPAPALAQNALDEVLAKKVITIAIPTDFPPYGFVGTDLKPQGLDIDMAQLIGARLGVKVGTPELDLPAMMAHKDATVKSNVDGVALPSYRGDAVNGLEFTPESRIARTRACPSLSTSRPCFSACLMAMSLGACSPKMMCAHVRALNPSTKAAAAPTWWNSSPPP